MLFKICNHNYWSLLSLRYIIFLYNLKILRRETVGSSTRKDTKATWLWKARRQIETAGNLSYNSLMKSNYHISGQAVSQLISWASVGRGWTGNLAIPGIMLLLYHRAMKRNCIIIEIVVCIGIIKHETFEISIYDMVLNRCFL